MKTPEIHILSEPDHISRHAERMLSTPAIGVDTEFVRERTYFPRPGLFQFSNGDEVWLLDPVALEGQAGLQSLLADLMTSGNIVKILHSTGEDLEVIELVGQTAPAPLFDTQRAAALLGWPLQVRYEVLAKELIDADFPGGLGRNDWCRRPLPTAWIEYAANDVIALPDMREVLADKLEGADRLAWLHEDCQRILDRALEVPDPVVRIKGAAALSDAALERLARLANWREAQARQRDLPRGFVIADPVMLELVRVDEVREKDLEQFTGQKHGIGKRDRAAIIELLEAPPSDYSRPSELKVLSAQQRARIKAMQGRIRAVAEELGVEPAVIASKRDLTRKVQGAPVDWLKGWRGDLLGSL